ncbi:ankyrin repeat-containing domain protein, partial [Tuber indicum]
ISANALDDEGNQPLITAVLSNKPKMVQLLLSKEEYDVDVNTSLSNFGTPLKAAIMSQNIEIVSILLKHPKINVNSLGHRPGQISELRWAIYEQNMDILRLLLADPRVNISLTNGDIETPLLYAIYKRDVNAVQLLL